MNWPFPPVSGKWSPRPLKYYLERNDSGVWGTDPETAEGTPVVRSTDIGIDGSWHLDEVAVRDLTQRERSDATLRTGDIVVVTSSGSKLHLGKSALVSPAVAELNACFSNFVQRLRTNNRAEPRYVWYLLNSIGRDEMLFLSSTTTGLQNLSGGVIDRVTHPGASLNEQRAIADFLDRETARIDALITKKLRLNDLVGERFWEKFSHRVEATERPLIPLRRFLTSITDGPFGSSLKSEHYRSEGARVVRLGNIGFAEFRDFDHAFIEPEYFEVLRRYEVKQGDLLIAGLGDSRNHVGRACVAPDLGKAIVKADCYRVRTNGRGSGDFLAFYLSSSLGRRRIGLATRGSTRSRINVDVAKVIPVPHLSVEEQEALVEWALTARRRTEATQAKLSDQITLLQEHRRALITAAATGQLGITTAA